MSKVYYKAFVEVFKERIYVDTYTGEGFEEVLKCIDPYISNQASKTRIPSYNYDDCKSELTLIAIEGIKNFDPSKNIKLSTFLLHHISNKKISRIKRVNKLSKDAVIFKGTLSGGQDNKYRVARNEIGFSQLNSRNMSGDHAESRIENNIPEEGIPGQGNSLFRDRYERCDFETSLDKACSKLDSKTREIINLIYYKDYSVKDAAKKVGMTGWAASLKLQKLSRRNTFRNMFGIESEVSSLGEKNSEIDDVFEGQE